MSTPALILVAGFAVCTALTLFNPERVWPRYLRAAVRWVWSAWGRRLAVVVLAFPFAIGCASVQDDNGTPTGTTHESCAESETEGCAP